MKCKNIEILLSDMLEGSLDNKNRKMVEDHLLNCPSCRDKLKNLQNYKVVVSKLESQDVPPELKQYIWNSIVETKVDQIEGTGKPGPAVSIIITALAASILLLVTIKPFSPPVISIDSSYSFITEKRGKGPAVERSYKKGSDPRVDKIISIADSTGVEYCKPVINKTSGQVDLLSLKIPGSKYSVFRGLFNSIKGVDSLPALPDNYKRRHVKLQVYIPGRSFFTGDFNGDRLDDFGLYFNRGKYANRIFISINNMEGNFEQAKEATTGSEGLLFKPSDKILSGDFNGDGLDDLLINYQDSSGADSFRFFINKGDNVFDPGNNYFFGKISNERKIWREFLTGDFNGDSYDDIAVMNYREEHKGLLYIYLNKKDKTFAQPYLFDAEFEGMDEDNMFTPLLMDINGDDLCDLCIYWQSGKRDAYWYFSLNKGKGKGSDTFYAGFGKGHMAFMGSYLPLTGDIDGDGYDELLVKSGVADEISSWYLMQNRQDSTFAMGRALLFDNKQDLVIR